MFRQLVSLIALVVLAGTTIHCRRNLDAVGKKETPLVFLVSPSYGNHPASLQKLHAYLERRTGLSLQIRVAPSESAAVVRAGTTHVDMGLLPLFGYLLCRQEFGVEAGLRLVRKGGATSYQGEILVRKDSPAKSLRDLTGKRVAFVSRYSTTGFLLPAQRLRKEGVAFTPVFAGSHSAALALLRQGRAAAAAAYHAAAALEKSVRVLTTTERIPNEPIFFRKGLPAATRRVLARALQRFAQTPDGKRALANLAGIAGFKATNDAAYAQVQKVITAAGKRVEDLVPKGWWIRSQARTSPADLAP